MNKQEIWQAFAETGDPICYLLYKSMENLDRAADA